MYAPSIRSYIDMTKQVDVTPYMHQCDAYARGCDLLSSVGCYSLLHDMGTGKTVTSIALIGEMRKRHNVSRVLVVCPSSVISAWKKDFVHAKFQAHVHILQGKVSKREEIIRLSLRGNHDRLDVFVTNYEALSRMQKTLIDANFDMVICDESQRIKAPGSKQSRCAHSLGRRARFCMILTGTPIPEGVMGWYAQFRFLNQNIFGTSFVAFRTKYAVEVDCGTFKKIVGYRNKNELESKIMSVSHRVRKEDALDLPEQIDIKRTFILDKKSRKLYDDLVNHSIAEIEESGSEVSTENILTRLLRLQQLAGGFLTDDDGVSHAIHDGKIILLNDVLADILSARQKAVVFYKFTSEGNAIIASLEKNGIGYSYINGSVASHLRGENVRSFQEDNDVKVFVAQIQAAGLGITLTAASNSIFYSTGYSAGDYQQARARTHRIGQLYPVAHIHLVAEETVDDDIQDALIDKRRISDECVDGGWKRFLRKTA